MAWHRCSARSVEPSSGAYTWPYGPRPVGPPRARHFSLAQAWHATVVVGPELARPDPRAVPGPPTRHSVLTRPGPKIHLPYILPIKNQTLAILSSPCSRHFPLLPPPIPHPSPVTAVAQAQARGWRMVASEPWRSCAWWPVIGGGVAHSGQQAAARLLLPASGGAATSPRAGTATVTKFLE